MNISGLHHITLVCSNAQRTVDFYTAVLGLRLVKQTVNFDDPGSYHLYFGDQLGRPGTVVTFFEWPHAPRGASGIGGTHHFALQVADEQSLLRWKRRLTDYGIRVNGPRDRAYFKSLYFRDPDGAMIELATAGPGFAVDEALESLGSALLHPPQALLQANGDQQSATWPDPVPEITPEMSLQPGMHHISAIASNIERTDEFYSHVLGLQRVKKTSNFDDPNSAHWYWGIDNGRPGSIITCFEHSASHAPRMRMGLGQTHHFALAVPDDATQLAFRERLQAHGYRVSPVLDRVYFRSIYTNDPDGHIVELATAGPGFAIDEAVATLGHELRLPPWLEHYREQIERRLTPLQVNHPLEAAQ